MTTELIHSLPLLYTRPDCLQPAACQDGFWEDPSLQATLPDMMDTGLGFISSAEVNS